MPKPPLRTLDHSFPSTKIIHFIRNIHLSFEENSVIKSSFPIQKPYGTSLENRHCIPSLENILNQQNAH